jgi:hypothetical protein
VQPRLRLRLRGPLTLRGHGRSGWGTAFFRGGVGLKVDRKIGRDSIPEGITYVEKHESKQGFGSHQFWHGLKAARDSDGIIGCCPLVAPSSFQYS